MLYWAPERFEFGVRALNLDDVELLHRQDPGGMAKRIGALPASARTAWQKAQYLALPAEFKQVHNALVLGMGESAIGGDLLRSLVEHEAKVPITVHRNYELPAFAGHQTLAIACSHSGATEETVTQFREAFRRGCKLLAISTGGTLIERAHAAHASVFEYHDESAPRAALAYLFLPLLAFFQQLNFISDKSADVEIAFNQLDRLQPTLAPESPQAENPAKQIAADLAGCFAVVYGAGIQAEVAQRWKTQFNENAKNWAGHETLPEVNHNGIAGYEFPAELKDRVCVIILEPANPDPRVALRIRVTRELLDERGVKHRVVTGQGDNPLAEILGSILLGDYVSYYLAQLNGTDPTSVRAIDHLKLELAKHAQS